MAARWYVLRSSEYEAIFDGRLRGSERVRVLLAFLNDRQVRLELPASQITGTGTHPMSGGR